MEKLVATIAKNAREELRVELTEYRGHELVSIRVWIDKSDGSGKAPTPKGITCKAALLPAIVAALADAEPEARAAGLLDGPGT